MRFAAVLLCGYGAFYLAKLAFTLFYPFVFALLVAYLMQPVIVFLENRFKLPRAAGAFAVIAAGIVLILGILVLIAAELLRGSIHLADSIPHYVQLLMQFSERMMNDFIMPQYQRFLSIFQNLEPGQQETISIQAEKVMEQIVYGFALSMQHLLLQLPEMLMIIPSSLTAIMFSSLSAFFIAADWQRLSGFWTNLMPERTDRQLRSMTDALKASAVGFFKAQFILLALTGILLFAGLLILRVEHALTISLGAVAVDLLPYLGTGVMFLPWIAFSFLTGNYGLAAGLSILYMVIIIVRQLLEPKILASSTGINPLALLIAMFACLKLWGAAGLLFAPLLLVFFGAMKKAGIIRSLWQFIKG